MVSEALQESMRRRVARRLDNSELKERRKQVSREFVDSRDVEEKPKAKKKAKKPDAA